MRKVILGALAMGAIISFTACRGTPGSSGQTSTEVPFIWENANIYFLLTDRFNDGDETNNINFGREQSTAVLRGFEGGDLKGIVAKIREGYFNDLGVNALWFTPVVEQVHGLVDEGTGATYGYHGYWTKDWTSLDPNFGTWENLKELVETAHKNGIRVIMDVVLNHTGPVTDMDPVWPANWVRTEPKCDFNTYEGTVTCTLVKNLPDIRTESDQPVDLPPQLLEKWRTEGRLEQELTELDAFFTETGLPRAPRYYIMKWIIDLIRDLGVDGFRIDTAKHVEESVWQELIEMARKAFKEWKEENPEKVLDGNDFYILGEVYNYNITATSGFDFGDRVVNYYDYGFRSLINFEFKQDAVDEYEKIFYKYSRLLNGELADFGVVNYISSHDDAQPFDASRQDPVEAGTKLLLCPGTVQTYYGDETARSLIIPGTEGDATLRSFMNWDEVSVNLEKNGYRVGDVLSHWQKLGQFRAAHPAVGAGIHKKISGDPYLFTRSLEQETFLDIVLVGLDLAPGENILDVDGIFEDGSNLREYYSGQEIVVENGEARIDNSAGIILLGKPTRPASR
jgi:alpha-amylase